MAAREKWRRHEQLSSAHRGLEALEERVLLSASQVGGPCMCPMCRGSLPDPTLTSGTTVAASQTPAYPLASTFRLNSLPGAKHTIYLDFTGHTARGTLWNYSGNGATITTPAYNTDGRAGFSSGELQRIQEVWQRVAEDFAPFNVNVTTQEPSVGALVRSSASDTAWGVRVVIGGSGNDWAGGNYGGIAYVNSFGSIASVETPAYVFPAGLYNGHAPYVAEAASHEVGHTLGLLHDGTSTAEYHDGGGGWAPIMGVGYYEPVTQWSRGAYADADNKEDDLSIIASAANGFGYRADDAGNTLAAANMLGVVGTSVGSGGLIERNSDLDVYSFETVGGFANFTVSPAAIGGNLNVLAEILDAAGNVVASANPGGVLSATLNATLTAGTYYLRVSGAGEASAGYDDYGSLGQYRVSGDVAGAIAPPSFSVSDVVATEHPGLMQLTVTMSQASTSQTSVVWGTIAGSARAGYDYYARTQKIVFQPGQTQKVVYVQLKDDAVVEAQERFWIGLTTPSGAILGRSLARVTLNDNDAAAASLAAWRAQQSTAPSFAWSGIATEVDDAVAVDVLANLPAVA